MKYGGNDRLGAAFTPFVVESFGRWSLAARKIFKTLVTIAYEQGGSVILHVRRWRLIGGRKLLRLLALAIFLPE
jgi:hypothetical protein